mmetsp:Transcript_85078/g.241343  ORF Transcript_85078/g.241343 Transcript_85078/m.241343 type:complete len:247 (+) Transcript_85078:323-1063(+)
MVYALHLLKQDLVVLIIGIWILDDLLRSRLPLRVRVLPPWRPAPAAGPEVQECVVGVPGSVGRQRRQPRHLRCPRLQGAELLEEFCCLLQACRLGGRGVAREAELAVPALEQHPKALEGPAPDAHAPVEAAGDESVGQTGHVHADDGVVVALGLEKDLHLWSVRRCSMRASALAAAARVHACEEGAASRGGVRGVPAGLSSCQRRRRQRRDAPGRYLVRVVYGGVPVQARGRRRQLGDLLAVEELL